MMKFKELLERAENENMAVHPANESQALTLLSELDKKGYVWKADTKLTAASCYFFFGADTHYFFGITNYPNCNRVKFGSLCDAKDEGCAIIEFGDIDFKEE